MATYQVPVTVIGSLHSDTPTTYLTPRVQAESPTQAITVLTQRLNAQVAACEISGWRVIKVADVVKL